MAFEGFYPFFQKITNNCQTTLIISDTHFNEPDLKNKIKRPNDEELLKILNSKIGTNDLVIHLGDCGDLDFIKRIKGKYKILIAGNHDTGLDKYREVFNEVYSGPVMIAEKLILSHEPIDVPWAFNIHGHIHSKSHSTDKRHFNVCGDAIGSYEPINFNQWMKQGHLAHIESIHRTVINKATKRVKKKREKQ